MRARVYATASFQGAHNDLGRIVCDESNGEEGGVEVANHAGRGYTFISSGITKRWCRSWLPATAVVIASRRMWGLWAPKWCGGSGAIAGLLPEGAGWEKGVYGHRARDRDRAKMAWNCGLHTIGE